MGSRELSRTERSHFNDPTFSDLSIILSDRVIAVHRVILCRESDYFRKLLSGGFKENGAREVELREDDPEAMMAMFRFMYGLRYAEDQAEWHDGKSMLPYVKTYVAADKYQVTNLKKAVMFNLKNISCTTDDRDIVSTLRAILNGMPEHEGPRPLMIDYCVHFLARLRKREDFLNLLGEVPELGSALLRHEDLNLSSPCYPDGPHGGELMCPRCCERYTEQDKWDERFREDGWDCPGCGHEVEPICRKL